MGKMASAASSSKKTPAKKSKATLKTTKTPKPSYFSSNVGGGGGGGASTSKTSKTPVSRTKAPKGQEPITSTDKVLHEDGGHQFYSSVQCIPQRAKFMKSDPLSGPTFGQSVNDNNYWRVEIGDFACIENPSIELTPARGKIKASAPFAVAYRPCQILAFFRERITIPPKSRLSTKKKGWGPLRAEVRWFYRHADLDGRNARHERALNKKPKTKKKQQNNEAAISGLSEVFESSHVVVVDANLLLGRLVLKQQNQQHGVGSRNGSMKYPVPTVVNYCRRYYLHEEQDIFDTFDREHIVRRGLECSELLYRKAEQPRRASYKHLGISSSRVKMGGTVPLVSLPPPSNKVSYDGLTRYTSCTLSHPLSQLPHANLFCPPSKCSSFPKWQLCIGDIVAVHCEDGAAPASDVDAIEGRDKWYPYIVPWSHCQITAIFREVNKDDDGMKEKNINISSESVSCEIRWFPRVSEALSEGTDKKKVMDTLNEIANNANRTCEEILEGKQISIINCSSLLGPIIVDDVTGLSAKEKNLHKDSLNASRDLGCRFLPPNRRTVSLAVVVDKEGKPHTTRVGDYFGPCKRVDRGLEASNQVVFRSDGLRKRALGVVNTFRKERAEAERVARKIKEDQLAITERNGNAKEESSMTVAGHDAVTAAIGDIAAGTVECTERSPQKKRQLFDDDGWSNKNNAESKRHRAKESVSLKEAPEDTTMVKPAADTKKSESGASIKPPRRKTENAEKQINRVSCTGAPFHVDVSALKSFYEELDIVPPLDSYDGRYSIDRTASEHAGMVPSLWNVKLGDTVTIQVEQEDVSTVFHFPFIVPWAPAEVVSIYREHKTKESCAILHEKLSNKDQNMNYKSLVNEDAGEIIIEVRWLYRYHEIPGASKKNSNSATNDAGLEEVFETDQIDACSAHSILSPVRLHDVTKLADAPGTISGMPCIHYHCNRLWSIHRKSFLPSGTLSNRVERGRMHSAHKGALNKLQYKTSMGNSAAAASSKSEQPQPKKTWKESFQNAIRQLSLAEAAADAQEHGVVLACREKERAHITSFLRQAICGLTRQSSNNESRGLAEDEGTKNLKSSIFIAGPPGTGKTASVRSVIAELQKEQHAGLLPEFNFISINGMELRHPFDSYINFWEALSGTRKEKLPAGDAANRLEHYFCGDQFEKSPDDKTGSDYEVDGSDESKKPVIVLMLDEIDYLVTNKETIIYNFFDWPLRATTARMVVVGISNTINLPEKLQPRLTSRIGGNRCHFRSYNVQDTITILKTRLGMLSDDAPVFEDDAIKFAARKTANLSGDIRKAFHMCKVAAECVLEEYSSGEKKLVAGSRPIVRISDVQKGSRDLFTSIVHTAVKCSTTYESLFLISLGALKRTRADDGSSFSVRDILTKIESIANASGEPRYMEACLSFGDLLRMANRLGDAGIIQLQNRSNRTPWPSISTHLHTFEILGAYRDTSHRKLAEKHLAEARLF